MLVVIQRVKNASVSINNDCISSIEVGLLIYLGITHDDDENDIEYLVKKICNLRIFSDEQGKMNNSILSLNKKEVMIISQFTLFANCKKGNRPSFIDAAKPEKAIKLYEKFIEKMKDNNLIVKNGIFGADMKIYSINDGPINIILDSKTSNN